jgi:acyl-CoA synthetase (AMP-forming)/AMP-acid ligase II
VTRVTIADVLLKRARDTPDTLAYSTNGETITHGTLAADARRLAAGLAARGVERGDRCAIVLPTSLDFIRLVYACHLLAAAPVAINPDLPFEAILRRVRLVRARVAIRTSDAHTPADASSPSCPLLTPTDLIESGMLRSPQLPEPSDTAFLQLTSGTTGDPRAAVISHRSLLASLETTNVRLDMQPDDVFATWVPLHHDLGFVRYIFGAMLSGCPAHLIRPTMGNLRPWLDLVSRTRATITGGPDSAYRLAARTVDPAGLDLSRLRFAGNGGEPVRVATIEAFEQRFGRPRIVRPAYGLAEATLTVTSTAPGETLRVDAQGAVSCGRALDGIDVRVVDADGRVQSPGTAGDVVVRGAPVFDGYFDDDEATRETLRDGWLHTGDVGSLDADGYLFVTARARALIKRGGVTIAPREIEDAVNRVAGVAGSAAIGVVRSAMSATEDVVVVAEIADRLPNAPDTIRAHIGAEVVRAVGFAPGQILLVPANAIPRTAAGKVRYDELRRMVKDDSSLHAFPAPR